MQITAVTLNCRLIMKPRLCINVVNPTAIRPKFEPLRFNLQRFVIRICKRWQTITETGSVSSIVNLLSPFATARQINVSQLLSNGIQIYALR